MSSSTPSLLRWLRTKRYHIEVTTSVYMFTPAEKIVFFADLLKTLTALPDTIAFLLIGLFSFATFIYLPHYLAYLSNRISFYVTGENASGSSDLLTFAKEQIASLVDKTEATTQTHLVETATQVVDHVAGVLKEEL